MDWPEACRFLAELEPGAHRDLLRVLTSSSEVRADMIRQFHERGKEDMAGLLMLLEEQEWARQAMIEESLRPSKGMTSKRLTPEQVHAVGVAALNNAASLMVDAGILLESDRPRSAYAVGVIAVEEAAKFLRCRGMLLGWTDGITVAELNKELQPRFSAHVQRYAKTLEYMRALAPPVPLPPGFKDLHALAESDIRARERVLYVEVAPSGAPMTAAGVSEDHARTWVSEMLKFFGTLVNAWRSGLDEALAAARDRDA